MKTFEQVYFQMSETKQRNLRIGGGGYGGIMEDELGMPKPILKDAFNSSTPRVDTSNTTPRGTGQSTTPRGVKSGLSTTPRGAAK